MVRKIALEEHFMCPGFIEYWNPTAADLPPHIRERALQLTQERLKFGLSTQLYVTRAQNQLDALKARVSPTQATIQHQLSLIAVYSGRTPESVDQLVLATPSPVPVPAASAPQTLPSEALLRRPDVLTAYATVEQHAAQVGVAKAERY